MQNEKDDNNRENQKTMKPIMMAVAAFALAIGNLKAIEPDSVDPQTGNMVFRFLDFDVTFTPAQFEKAKKTGQEQAAKAIGYQREHGGTFRPQTWLNHDLLRAKAIKDGMKGHEAWKSIRPIRTASVDFPSAFPLAEACQTPRGASHCCKLL